MSWESFQYKCVKPWSNESAIKLWLAMTPCSQTVTSSALSLYSLTFLRWYISYDSPLKRCLKDTFLLPLLTCVFPSLTISFLFPFGLGPFGFAALLLSLWVLLWFKTTSTSSEAAMFNFDTKDVDLCLSWFKQLASLRKLKETCDDISKTQISRKLKTSNDLRSRQGSLYSFPKCKHTILNIFTAICCKLLVWKQLQTWAYDLHTHIL